MCDPTLALVAIAAAGTGVETIAQNQIASQQARAINSQLATRRKEIDRAATAEMNNRLREMRREQSRIMVAAGEAGLSLSSGGVENLLLDSVMQAELANDASIANRESRRAAADADAQAAMPAKTTVLGAGLKIGLSAGGKYFQGEAAKERANT